MRIVESIITKYVDTLVCTLFLFLSRQDYWVHGISVEVCKRTLSLGAIVFLSCWGNRQVKYSRVIQNTKCKKRIMFNCKNYYACQGTIRFCAFLHFTSQFLCLIYHFKLLVSVKRTSKIQTLPQSHKTLLDQRPD